MSGYKYHNNPLADELRDWIAEVLARTGWSISELADKANVHRTTIWRFLKRHNVMNFSTVQKIVNATGEEFVLGKMYDTPMTFRPQG